MNKQELAKQIACEMSVTITDAMRFINAFQNAVTTGLKRKELVTLYGFGTFWPWSQTERMARNPKTGKEVMIQPRASAKFKPGIYLLEALNKGK